MAEALVEAEVVANRSYECRVVSQGVRPQRAMARHMRRLHEVADEVGGRGSTAAVAYDVDAATVGLGIEEEVSSLPQGIRGDGERGLGEGRHDPGDGLSRAGRRSVEHDLSLSLGVAPTPAA